MLKYANEHVDELRKAMRKDGIKAYLIVTGDPHNSEEPAARFAAERRFFCPFDGDNAYVLITEDEALVWTDGRFFVSAEEEIKGSYFSLMKLYTPGYPLPEEYIKAHNLYPLGTDLLLLSPEDEKALAKNGVVVDKSYSFIMPEVPSLPTGKIWRFDDPRYQDLSREEKLSHVYSKIKEEGAQAHLLCTLDDIAYLLNLRGTTFPIPRCSIPTFISRLRRGRTFSSTGGNWISSFRE